MNYKNKNKNKKRFYRHDHKRLLGKGLGIFNIKTGWRAGLGILTLTMILVYLFQVNCLAITGFEIKEIERDIYTLQKTNKELTLQVTQLRSINNLEKVAQDLSMVVVNQAEHLSFDAPVVALNK